MKFVRVKGKGPECPHCGQPIELTRVVARVVDGRRHMSIADIKIEVRKVVKATDKAIYNALSCLTRKHAIRKMGYGVYSR